MTATKQAAGGMNGLHHIDPVHEVIHSRLINWARYVKVTGGGGFIQPMWKQGKSSRQWDESPHINIEVDTLDGHAQSKHDNRWLAGNAVDYRLGLIARIGLERVEALENDNVPHKWTREDLTFIKALYIRKLKDLKAAL